MKSSDFRLVGLVVLVACSYDKSELAGPPKQGYDGAVDHQAGGIDGKAGVDGPMAGPDMLGAGGMDASFDGNGGTADVPITSAGDTGMADTSDTQALGGAGGTGGAGGMGGTSGIDAVIPTGGTGGVVGNGGMGGGGGSGGTAFTSVTTTGGIVGSGGKKGTDAGVDASSGSGGAAGANGTGGITGPGGAAGTPSGSPGPSCIGLGATCGPSGNESCCASLLVPGGTFYRSYDGVDYADKGYPATVSNFALDRYEITVGRFRAFVNAGMGTQASPPSAGAGAHPTIAGSGWDSTWNANLPADTPSLKSAIKCSSSTTTWTDSPGSIESRPMGCISWYEAFAFCAWDGGRLPTEAEWNYAAAGGAEQRYYPWSIPPASTMIDHTYALYSCGGSGCYSTQNVGTNSPKGDGRWGHADLGGNVWEKTLDWYTSPYSPATCNGCASLAPTVSRVERGGSVGSTELTLRNGYRNHNSPTSRFFGVGSRCARDATQ